MYLIIFGHIFSMCFLFAYSSHVLLYEQQFGSVCSMCIALVVDVIRHRLVFYALGHIFCSSCSSDIYLV